MKRDKRTTKIYTLENALTGEVRYIGKTVNKIKRRLDAHISNARIKCKTHSHRWINSLNGNVIIRLLDEVDHEDWAFWEQYWINQFNNWGFKLTNHSLGGEGAYGHKHTQEFCDNMSIRNKRMGIVPPSSKGRVLSDSTKRKLSNAHKGKVLSEEHKEKLRGKRRPTRNKTGVKIVQMTQDDVDIKVWDSSVDACESLGMSSGNIARAIRQGTTCGSFKWKHYEKTN